MPPTRMTEPTWECPYCHAENHASREECWQCADETPQPQCHACNGTGRRTVRGTDITVCWTCDGTGRQPQQQE